MSHKIVFFNGSPRGKQSNTKAIIEHVLDKIPYKADLEVTYIDSFQYKIRPCSGCSRCFLTGKCPLDKEDDMKAIKHSLLTADLIILGTPVFAGNISGQFKILIDRLAYWLHLMCLCGKPVVVVTSSCGNGVYFTDLYLKSIVKFLGGIQIANANYTIFEHDNIYSKDVDDINSDVAKRITKWFDTQTFDNKAIMKDLDTIFNSMQQNMKLYEQEPNFEYRYWDKNGLFNFNAYEEVIIRCKSITEYLMGEI